MLAALIRFSLTQRLLIVLATALLATAGWYAYDTTPVDAFPEVSVPQVKIILKSPGMTPEEVERRITAPLEVELLGIPRQRMLRSVAKYGLTDVTIDFEDGTDVYWARQQVAERLNGLRDSLPTGVSGGIAPLTTPLGEMFMFTIEGGDLTDRDRRELLDWVIRPALRTVPGVADVNALGGRVRSWEIVPDPVRMASRRVTHAMLVDALQANNRDDGAGRLSEGEETLLVRSTGAVRELDDVREIVVLQDRTEPVRVADVAEVRFGSLTRYGAVTRDGSGEAVQGLVLGLRGANAREVVAGVRARLEEIAATLPDGVHVDVFYDRGELVDRAVGTVRSALIQAVVLVVALLVLFLGDLRAAVTVALVLPLAALGTFLLMRAFDMSANLMSLGGLAIAIGMLVDSAVVVTENVVEELRRTRGGPLPRLHVIYRAARDVAPPLGAGTLIIVIVFLPLLTLQGLEGKLFAPVAITIVFALASAFLLSLTVIPVLASLLLSADAGGGARLTARLEALYAPLLDRTLRHGRIVVAAALLLLVAAALAFTQVGKTFMPTLDEGTLVVQLEKMPSIDLARSVEVDLAVQRALMELPEVEGVIARVGSDELGLDPMGLNQTDSYLRLAPREEWTVPDVEALVAEIRARLEQFPGVEYTFTQPIQMRVDEMLTGVRGDLAVKVFGEDEDAVRDVAGRLVELLDGIDGAADVYTPRNAGQQYLELDPARLQLGRYGLDVASVQDALRARIEGQTVATVYEGMRRFPMVIRGGEEDVSVARWLDAPVAVDGGDRIRVDALVDAARTEGPVAVNRELGRRMAVVVANVSGRDLVGFVDEARARVAETLDLPVGVSLAWGGEFENQQRAAARLALVVPMALGLIFLVLFSTFGSLRLAGLVLSNVPFALVGGVFGLLVTGAYLSVPASVGFIALLGIAVLNGVVLVSYYNQLRATGMPLAEVVREGAMRRLRPVMMTAASTAFGLIPLLFATGPGSEVQKPLAIVVIGGLLTSTALTLLLLPLLYRRFAEPRNA
ncbi:MAG: CusA/CzcA family heavy metal efflux RND transporter [Pseudomonadales bacterium]|jgi:cobalt-zinc-cadmium resistance protein CzcA|nr:CusA/CzcA family heavy metal efflux RND transporter [Pseudomonadales bacterium]